MHMRPDILTGGRMRRSARRGFTLVELLVVIGIIVLLLGILAPAIMQALQMAERGLSQSNLNMIEAGVKAYSVDFDDAYPPSDGAAAGYSGWDGSELLTLLLTGYGPDTGRKGEPSSNLFSDDGCEGWGFRLKLRGRVYGPFAGVEGLPMTLKGNDRRVFTDKFDNVIRYYVYDKDTDSYDAADDDDPPSDFSAYIKDGSGNYYRRDFLLMSEGADGQWDDPDDRNDDVTNFTQ